MTSNQLARQAMRCIKLAWGRAPRHTPTPPERGPYLLRIYIVIHSYNYLFSGSMHVTCILSPLLFSAFASGVPYPQNFFQIFDFIVDLLVKRRNMLRSK